MKILSVPHREHYVNFRKQVKEFPAFYGTRRFIAVFKTATCL